MRYIYDELVQRHGDPQVAPLPVPLDRVEWRRARRVARIRQEEVLRGLAGKPAALPAQAGPAPSGLYGTRREEPSDER